MDKKSYTILITSNRKGVTKTLTISAAWMKAFGFLGFVFGLIVVTAAVDYLSLLLEAGQSKYLLAENATLKSQLNVVKNQIHSLETGLERVKTFYTKLKQITNIDDEDRSLNLTLGQNAPGQELVPLVGGPMNREPTSEFLRKTETDAKFLAKPPLDESKRELYNLRSNEFSSLSVRIDRAVKETELQEQSVMELYATLEQRLSLLSATPSLRPVNGWFTSRFGYRVDPFTGRPQMHQGLDIAASPGTPVYAPAEGIVAYVGNEPGYGKIVVIDHGYGVKTRYAHNSQVYVELGQKVSRKELVSAVGNTGRSSGPHLHYEVRVNDIPVDPINYVLDE